MGGVLLDLHGERAIAAFEQLGAIRTSDYVREFRTEDMFLGIEDGTMSTEEFCEAVRQNDVLSVDKAPNEAIITAWKELLNPLPASKREALETLRARGHRLFILSNTCELHWQFATQSIPTELFERCFVSYEMGLRKPDVAIYERVCAEAGISPADTLFIDDNPDNIAGANQAGLNTLLERTGTDWITQLV